MRALEFLAQPAPLAAKKRTMENEMRRIKTSALPRPCPECCLTHSHKRERDNESFRGDRRFVRSSFHDHGHPALALAPCGQANARHNGFDRCERPPVTRSA